MSMEAQNDYYFRRRRLTIEKLDLDISREALIRAIRVTFTALYGDHGMAGLDLLIRPIEATKLCDAVRRHLKCFDIPDDLICCNLLTLLPDGDQVYEKKAQG